MKINGSQIIIECLVEQGVDTVFGFPGGSVLYIYDALYMNRDRIRHILTCHEQNAAHAADGYARATGKVGVCIATSGPGATNLVTGIATAYMDSVPTVFITGNVGRKYIGKDSFQEVDIQGITIPITKHNYIVRDINKLADTIREAFYIARSGRPGPVLIDIPKDISAAVTEYTYKEPKPIDRTVMPDMDKLKEAADIIAESERPLIFAGGGVIAANASPLLKQFAELIDAPVCQSLMGLGCFPEDHDLSLGMVGMHGTIASNKAITDCDCLIALGVRFSDRVLTNMKKFASDAKIIHIDIDVSEIGKNIVPYLGIVADITSALNGLLGLLTKKNNSEWIVKVNENKKGFVNFAESKELNPKYMMEVINQEASDKAIITTEVGQHQMWAAQYYKYLRPRTLLTSGGLGTMGFGTGAAMGAQIAMPNSRVFHIAGDGSFRMNLTELATIRKYNLPVIIVLVDNRTLGMVRQWQTLFYQKHYSNTDLDRGPDFGKLADAYGIDYYNASTKEEYLKAIKSALSKNEPALIQANIGIDEKVLPMIASGDVIDHFILD